MNKIKLIIVSLLIAIFLLPNFVFADSVQNNMYFFWGEGCPHCAKEKEFLNKIKNNYPQINVVDFEIYNNSDNASLLQTLDKELNLNISGVPFIIIGDQGMSGYLNDETSGQQIIKMINQCLETQCPDLVANYISQPNQNQGNNNIPQPQNNNEHFYITLPILGEIDAKAFSLPILTLVIAALDGFNPCAMWVLVFLISLLIGMKNKKRMWALGISFIVASGLVYFLFLSAWLSFFLFIGYIFWIRLLIGAVAIGSGIYHLYEFYINRPGCKVVKGERREKMFTNLKFITKIPSFWLALVGIVLIAFAVNLIELVCSAGLPAIYTNILSLSNLPTWQFYLYLIFYIIIFMLDDIIVFVIAMITLQATGLTHKYVRAANLIGGILILILGILLILKPQLLMFS